MTHKHITAAARDSLCSGCVGLSGERKIVFQLIELLCNAWIFPQLFCQRLHKLAESRRFPMVDLCPIQRGKELRTGRISGKIMSILQCAVLYPKHLFGIAAPNSTTIEALNSATVVPHLCNYAVNWTWGIRSAVDLQDVPWLIRNREVARYFSERKFVNVKFIIHPSGNMMPIVLQFSAGFGNKRIFRPPKLPCFFGGVRL